MTDKRTQHVSVGQTIDDAIIQVRKSIAQLEILREQVKLVEHELGRDEICPIKLTPAEKVIWYLLMRFQSVSISSISAALWGGLPDADCPDGPLGLITTHMCNIRNKLITYLVEEKFLAYLKAAGGNPIICDGGSKYGSSIYTLDSHIKQLIKSKCKTGEGDDNRKSG